MNYENNGSFTGTLQCAWDSTSLGELKTCPRKYYYSIVLGYAPRGQSVHLDFGLFYHSALETYDHAKSQGATHEEALRAATKRALTDTWNSKLKRPWISDDPNKNRATLVRSIVWYLDQFAEDPLQTLQLANGKPAVELSFRFESPYPSPNGLPYMLCGHLDRVVTFNGDPWVLDRKTTKSTISPRFFDSFSPDNQMTLYTLAGQLVLGSPVKGIIIDAAQIAVTFSRFERGIVTRTQAQLDEWLADLHHWLSAAEEYSAANYWPMNDKACGLYGGCPFRSICSKSPQVRDDWLKTSFVSRRWDPTIARGDI